MPGLVHVSVEVAGRLVVLKFHIESRRAIQISASTAMCTTACYRIRPETLSIMAASQMTRRIRNSSCKEGRVSMIYLPNRATARYKRNARAPCLLSKRRSHRWRAESVGTTRK